MAAPGSQIKQKCLPKAPKWSQNGVQDPPERILNGDLAHKGDICNPHTMCYVSATSAGPGKACFCMFWHPKGKQNRVPDRGHQKYLEKSHRCFPNGVQRTHKAPQGQPRGSQVLPNSSPKSLEHSAPGPGCPQRSPKVAGGALRSPKVTKICRKSMQNRLPSS